MDPRPVRLTPASRGGSGWTEEGRPRKKVGPVTGEPTSTRPSATVDLEARRALRAVVEALRPEDDAHGASERLAAACGEAGRALAGAGVPLGGALDALAGQWGSVLGEDPPFAAVRSFADAWGDGTLAWLHRLDCRDPLTGLAGPGHLRTRVSEVLAEPSPRDPGWAVVVADLGGARPANSLAEALLLARAGAMVRSVFGGEETAASLGGARLGLLARGGGWLTRRSGLLERMLATTGLPEGTAARRVATVTALPLPDDADEAHALLDILVGGTPEAWRQP